MSWPEAEIGVAAFGDEQIDPAAGQVLVEAERPQQSHAAMRVDNEITDADREWVSTHHHGQALLHHVASHRGLTDDDFAALDQWLRAA